MHGGEAMSKASKKTTTHSTTTHPNDPTIAKFFEVFTPGNKYKKIGWLVANVFCPDTPTPPSVGIAIGADPMGPQFRGVAAVTKLFKQLTTSFPNLVYWPSSGTPYCYSDDQLTTTIQTTLKTGPHTKPWFAFGDPAYSKPLSDIEPRSQKSIVPTCSVFTFDSNHKILRLGIYMDRWQMAVDLWPGTPTKSGIRPFPHP